MELTQENARLFERLIIASGKLATQADLAGSVLSEQFEDMCGAQITEVREILAECPVVDEAWDGELREDDLKIEIFRTNHQPINENPAGVKIVHLPTGIGRQSESKNSQLENKEVAMKALRKAVAKEFEGR